MIKFENEGITKKRTLLLMSVKYENVFYVRFIFKNKTHAT